MFRKAVVELFETSLPLAMKVLEVMGYALKLEVCLTFGFNLLKAIVYSTFEFRDGVARRYGPHPARYGTAVHYTVYMLYLRDVKLPFSACLFLYISNRA